MKKFLALATLLVVLLALPLTAGAERSGWKSNTFPFKNVKVVYLKDLSRQDTDFRKAHPAFIRDDDAVRKTLLTLQRDFKKKVSPCTASSDAAGQKTPEHHHPAGTGEPGRHRDG